MHLRNIHTRMHPINLLTCLHIRSEEAKNELVTITVDAKEQKTARQIDSLFGEMEPSQRPHHVSRCHHTDRATTTNGPSSSSFRSPGAPRR